MQVRGAPLIGAAAAYGLALGLCRDASDAGLAEAYGVLHATRPTAINLKWALDEIAAGVRDLAPADRVGAAYARAAAMCEEDVALNAAIGRHGIKLLEAIAARKKPGERVNILTHCNAGWLATVDRGTATAAIYLAHERQMPLHVWVDETRPRNQGASLTAWELGQEGVPHTIIPDNTGGHLMQHGLVDVCNKIGTYLKALAARDNGVPFYVALPSPTLDFRANDRAIPIEQRPDAEVATMTGRTTDGRLETISIIPPGSRVANYAFDVTPARLVSGLITERGVIAASRTALAAAFPERVTAAATTPRAAAE
jgi:methylthioribose-1-phosphate isomerase